MAIAWDAASSVTKTGVGNFTNVTWSHTTGASLANSIIVVNNGWFNQTPDVSGVTYNAVAATRIGAAHNVTTNFINADQWRLLAPAAGANTVSVTFTANITDFAGGAVTYQGVDQTTPTGTQATATGGATSSSIGVSSVANDVVVDCVARLGSGAVTPGTGQAERFDVMGGGAVGIAGDEETATGATTTMSHTFASSDYAACGVALKPVAAGGDPEGALVGGKLVNGGLLMRGVLVGGH